MSLKTVKSKIKSIDKTRQVTKAMEAVSAVKMRKAQTFAIHLRPYARAAMRMLRSVSGARDAGTHPLLEVRAEKKIGLIVVATDKGLAGSLVGNILKKASKFLDEKGFGADSTHVIAVGRKAIEYFGKRNFPIVASYEKWGDVADFSGVLPLVQKAEEEFLSGNVDAVYIVYTNFHSTLSQEVVVKKLFPVTFKGVAQAVAAIVPEKGKFSELRAEDKKPIPHYVFEPSPHAVLEKLIPVLVQVQLYHAILESNASEHSARMFAMKNASDNAKDISHKLKNYFNRVRQAAITREVSEIVGGMEAMKTQ